MSWTYSSQGPGQIDTDERVIRPDQFIKEHHQRKSVIFGISEMCSGPGMTVVIYQLDF